MVLAAMLVLAAPGWPAEKPNEISLDDAREQIGRIQKQVPVANDDRTLLKLRQQALALQSKMHATSADLQPRVTQLAARIAELGAHAPGTAESSAVAAQRKDLEQQHTALEGRFKLASLLSLEVDQVVTQIAARSRERFRERLTDRVRSPVERGFWADLGADVPQDLQQARAFALELGQLLRQISPASIVGALAIVAVTLIARWQLMGWLRGAAVKGRLHRSLRALAHIALWTLSTAIITASVLIPVNSGEELASLTGLFAGVAATITFGVYVASLGTALLAPRAPTWRLPPISD
ncbi:MAG TPA: DUF3772 domain-containing protein, partial [Polyangiales bacterium]|nr:DUF3772 domain-containing protein [Polyangiales bacterium]